MLHEYTRTNAGALIDLFNKRIDDLNKIVHGPIINGVQRKSTLAKMLEDGGFPETESKAMREAFDKFADAFLDLEMAMMIRFNMEDEGD